MSGVYLGAGYTSYDQSLCACSCGRRPEDTGVEPRFFEPACRALWVRQHQLHPALTRLELKALRAAAAAERAGGSAGPVEPAPAQEEAVVEPPVVLSTWTPPRSLLDLLIGAVRRVW